MKFLKVKSMHPLTEFAPSWDFTIGTDIWDADKTDIVRQWLIANEQRIIDTYPPNRDDGGTGLGIDSVTSRFARYNLLQFGNELPELNDLYKFIQISYLNYIHYHHSHIRDINIVCWYNVMRQGDKINEHAHGIDPYTYLSGNIHLDNYKTKTYYKSSIDKDLIIPIDNIKGNIAIFPGHIKHYTDEHTESNLRVSIGFDLHLNEDPRTPIGHELTLDFMNSNIFHSLTNEMNNV